MRNTFRVVLLVLTVLALSLTLLAQTETGSITGAVTDPSGAILSNAAVTVKSQSTAATRTANTNTSGRFAISSLKPDTYEVTISAPGFSNFTRVVRVSLGGTTDVDAKMTVGSGNTTVEVTASTDVATVNTENQTLSESITAKQLDELPTSPNRNPYALVGISGNVAEDTQSGRGAGFAINGQRSSSTSILLDGGENVDTFTATVGQTVPLDSVSEFTVQTNNYSAEYGRASGGVINVVTKSGSNEWHGSAYEFNRISALSSNTYNNEATNAPRGVFTRNNYGFSLGGPVKKNKLFFFNNLEWIRVRSNSTADYTILDPASYSAISPASQAFFSSYGKLRDGLRTVGTAPCGTLTCDHVQFNVPIDAGGGSPQNTWMEVGRVDFNLSDKTSMFGRYASYKELDFAGVVNNSPYAGYDTGQTNYAQNFTFNINHLFTPSLVNTTKIIYNRLNGPTQPLGTAPVSPTLYTAGTLPNVTALGSQPLVFPGYSETTPGNAIPFGGPQNLYQFYDDVSFTKGKHQFKFGGQFLQIRDNRIFGAYENAVELLGTNLSSGLANLVSGNIYQFQGAVYPQGKFPCVKNVATGVAVVTPACTLNLPATQPAFGRNYRYNDGALYAEDAWRLTRTFTLNLGIRWEYYGVQHNVNTNLDSNFVLGPGATYFDQIRSGAVQLAKNGGSFWKPADKNFGPHVGFAWDVFGNGKMSLRGGYSIGYERNFGNVTFNTIQNPPNYAVVSLIAGSDIPSMPVYTDNFGPLAGSGTKALPAVSQRAINQNMKTAYAESYDLAIDTQPMKNSVFTIAYAGSRGIHLYDIANINPVTSGGLYLGDSHFGNRLNLQYSNMNYRSDNGLSRYNALNTKFATNNIHNTGLTMVANYTWSHALDNLSSTFSDGISGFYKLGYIDAFNPRLDYGNADFDVRHRFVVSAAWDVPFFKKSGKILRNSFGGWTFGTVFTTRSGLPFTIYDCSNFNGTSCPNWVPTGAVAKSSSGDLGGNSFNYLGLPANSLDSANLGIGLGMPNCSGLHHTGCVYTTNGSPYPGRNGYRAPNTWNDDLNIAKNFSITERVRLQLRGEMYNLFNHHNLYVNGLNLDVSSMSDPFVTASKGTPFGYSSSSDERRNVQLGLRITF